MLGHVPGLNARWCRTVPNWLACGET